MEAQIPIGEFNIWITLILMVICLMAVAFFSSSEAALLSAKPLHIRHLAKKGDKRAQAIERLRKRYDRLFGTILATENMFIILATSLGTAIAIAFFGHNGIILATVIMTILVVIFGEITPKTLGASFSEPLSLAVSRILEAIVLILSPVIIILSVPVNLIMKIFGLSRKKGLGYSQEELMTAIRESEKEGVIASHEREFIEGVFEFSKTKAREAMVPRVKMVCIPENADLAQMKKIILKTGHSRYPVFSDNPDNILGFVSVKDMFLEIDRKREIRAKDLIRPCHFAPGSQRITTLLSDMRRLRMSMAIILDEYGGTAGLVTVETLLEEIVGEIEDEYDYFSSRWTPQEDGTIIVDAHFPLDEAISILQIPEPDCKSQTIGGYLITNLGRIPEVGDSVMLDKYIVKAEVMERYKVKKIKIIPKTDDEKEQPET
ncbi:MAG: HlyC/CorC family transporter [Candidatus Eremiobacteraeota bacterium]|nr:HlyC/CorC family transporter [Candidatus Eremiobacteraeota bacterium]